MYRLKSSKKTNIVRMVCLEKITLKKMEKSDRKKMKKTYQSMTIEQKIEILAHNFKVLFDRLTELEAKIK